MERCRWVGGVDVVHGISGFMLWAYSDFYKWIHGVGVGGVWLQEFGTRMCVWVVWGRQSFLTLIKVWATWVVVKH